MCLSLTLQGENIIEVKEKKVKKMTSVKRGDIYYADLSPVVGSEQGGVRPVLIIQNDVGNKYSPTVIAAAITSRMGKTKLPTHIDVYAERAGLARDSVVLLEQVRTLDKRRLREKMGRLDEDMMSEIDTAIAVSLGLVPRSTVYMEREVHVQAKEVPPAAVRLARPITLRGQAHSARRQRWAGRSYRPSEPRRFCRCSTRTGRHSSRR